MVKTVRRKSNVIPLDPNANKLRPPSGLPKPEREVFAELIASNPASHFRVSDMPLLIQYCSAVVLNERAAAELRIAPITPEGKASPWLVISEKTHRATVALAMRLRLSPQARLPKTITAKDQPTPSFYDMMRGLEDDEPEERP
jgi:hypothetical protein